MYNVSENKTKQERWYVLLKEKLQKKKHYQGTLIQIL